MFGSVWLTVLSFEALLFTISIAFILLAMAKERTELRHRTAAMVDPLTGIANRRAFLQDASLLAKRHIGDPRPTAVLVIDLDHFKSINDRFGHALGDRVLEIFADAARKSMRGSIWSADWAARNSPQCSDRHQPRKGGRSGRADSRKLCAGWHEMSMAIRSARP